jgi:hypothetical protein
VRGVRPGVSSDTRREDGDGVKPRHVSETGKGGEVGEWSVD